MKRYLAHALALSLGALLISGPAMAAEHPGSAVEHPGVKVEKKGTAITAKVVKKSIKEHVKAASKATNGVFVVKDDKLNKEWKLKLDKIHDPVRKFEKEGKTIYFACSDFKAADSKDVLDIDFWMVEKSGTLEVIDTRIHKLNGEPRYTYEGTELKEIR
ncbi:hypothetical protein GEOBC_01172 [Geobacteraceae bacterium]|nr:hypothetical protein GEOBC_01172 [Geobacteraceae bacterium]